MLRPPPELKTMKGLRTWLNNLRAFSIATRPLRTETCEVAEGPDGSRILPDVGGSSSTSASAAGEHPFQFLVREKEDAEGQYEGKVVAKSSLLKDMRPDDRQTISGLDTWFDLIGNDAIWIGIVFNRFGVITSCSIDSWGQGDTFNIDEYAWSTNDGYCEDDEDATEPRHQTSRLLIAFTIAGPDGEPVPTQCLFDHLLLRNINIDGRPAKYPFPFVGPYIP